MKRYFSLAVVLLCMYSLMPSHLQAQTLDSAKKSEMCEKIKAACLHAWNGYKKYASGYDALKPLSKQGKNWYGTSLMMTPVDAFDTFHMLGMKEQADECKHMIFAELDFDVNEDVQFFEINIRLLGGLISAYELDGDGRFLTLAVDLAKRLMPAFNSPTGMPYRYVNLKTGATRDSITNPAEIGTCLLEFGKLTQLTGKPEYYKAAKKALMAVYEKRSKLNLVGTNINVNTGEWTNTESHIGGEIDSYYEYLLKGWLLFSDMECKKAWETSLAAIKKNLLRATPKGTFAAHVDMNTGKETSANYGALDAFFAGALALAGDAATAREIQKANYYMWKQFNMEPEVFNFKTNKIVYDGYNLRPENLESCFYLYRTTKDAVYLSMGKRMTEDILEKCRTEAGYAALKSVTTFEQKDTMESFFLAETLKYAYLLFAPESMLDLKKTIFNTEAHPFRRM